MVFIKLEQLHRCFSMVIKIKKILDFSQYFEDIGLKLIVVRLRKNSLANKIVKEPFNLLL